MSAPIFSMKNDPCWLIISSSVVPPMLECVFMISNSPGVSRPGLSRMLSGMPTLPMSCRAAERVRVATYSSSTNRQWRSSFASRSEIRRA